MSFNEQPRIQEAMDGAGTGGGNAWSARPGEKSGRRGVFAGLGDRLFSGLTRSFAVLTLVLLAGIIVALVVASWPSIREYGFGFLVSPEWNPPMNKFGALVPVYGTVVTALVALIIAVPVSFGIALFLTELSPIWVAAPARYRH